MKIGVGFRFFFFFLMQFFEENMLLTLQISADLCTVIFYINSKDYYFGEFRTNLSSMIAQLPSSWTDKKEK